jgi:GNAT superfamily N-acetyltransferase
LKHRILLVHTHREQNVGQTGMTRDFDEKHSAMKTRVSHFEILADSQSTKPFLDHVREAGDANRNSFGFLPNSVYAEFAHNDRLYVLVDRGVNGVKFAGHLLFDQRYPRAHVRQMFTHPDYRRSGVARRLINHLRVSLTSEGFTSIYARVAEDLCEANAFWESEQFHVQNVKDGGAVRKRKILVRCHELSSPQLFPSSGISSQNPLGLLPPSTDQTPMFLRNR